MTATTHALLLAFALVLAVLAAPGARAARPRKTVVLEFPEELKFGAATAAYQVEGAWNESGKGENIWDRMVHEHPEYVRDRSTGDVADDSYHKYEEDVWALKELGVNFYRFSISWARVMPQGSRSNINWEGVAYYHNLIDALWENGIEPMVTMYHWDLPQALQELGGWPNPVLADYFVDYAKLLFDEYGQKVKNWITFNEPLEFTMGYSSSAYMPPSIEKPGIGDYMATHTVLKAHARVYHMYDDDYRSIQGGNISITLNSDWIEPYSTSQEDIDAAERKIQFNFGWFAHPIFSAEGDYPEVMRERVLANSLAEGLRRSRLPLFTDEEVEYIRGTSDFFGLNHYTTTYALNEVDGANPSRDRDSGAITRQDPSWPGSASNWLKVVPWGFKKILNWIHKNYDGVTIMVTESGFSDVGQLNDYGRANYYTSYLEQLYYAMTEDGVNVIAYTAWSAIDNFEWVRGYTERFGVYFVDYSDPDLPRIPKHSASVLGRIFTTRKLEVDVDDDDSSGDGDGDAEGSGSGDGSNDGGGIGNLPEVIWKPQN